MLAHVCKLLFLQKIGKSLPGRIVFTLLHVYETHVYAFFSPSCLTAHTSVIRHVITYPSLFFSRTTGNVDKTM
ncbi:unnamed protein product [Schistosoma mansoni]|uniref:Smp_204430 n=1 Tax=Schistosoma mansoni TaxID=6183 RepID=UPI00022C81A4|nr:unnamed protein product [Schistosoma mansoni]|eukprot:XP_018645960.1 unnamed protein product [Schistosoma mansoni]